MVILFTINNIHHPQTPRNFYRCHLQNITFFEPVDRLNARTKEYFRKLPPTKDYFLENKYKKPNFLRKSHQIIFSKMQLSNQIRRMLLFKGIWQNSKNEPVKNQIKTRPKSVYI